MKRVEKECGRLKTEVNRLKSEVNMGRSSSGATNNNNAMIRESIRKEVFEEMRGKGELNNNDGVGAAAEDGGSKWNLRIPPCASKNTSETATSFLMVFMGHSGSSAILSEMRQHPKFFVTVPEPLDHGEYQTNTQKALEYTDEFFTNGAKWGKIPVH